MLIGELARGVIAELEDRDAHSVKPCPLRGGNERNPLTNRSETAGAVHVALHRLVLGFLRVRAAGLVRACLLKRGSQPWKTLDATSSASPLIAVMLI
ncbi:hypothetical protein CTI14_49295, partial [Methylobacterium radiotolerans]